MNTQELHDGFQADLIRQGLPVDYAADAAAELADHHRDLVEELRSVGVDETSAATEAAQRLGDRRQLVKKSVREFQRRHWCGRWPLLTFLIAPIPLMVLTCLAMMLISVCLFWPLELLGINILSPPDGIISIGERIVVFVSQGLYFFLAPALVMFFLTQLGNRAVLGPQLPLLSASILAVFSGMFLFDFADLIGKSIQLHSPADRVLMVMGLPLVESWEATWQWYTHDPVHVCQFLLPLAVATALLLHNKQLATPSLRIASDGC